MTTLLILAGAGIGALLATVTLLFTIARLCPSKKDRDSADTRHREMLAEMQQRNILLEVQNDILRNK